MILPQEIELWYVIPSIRKALVTELKKYNLKQKDIAPLLGITESAVSQYVRDKRASCCYDAFHQQPLKGEIERSAKTISAQKSPDRAVVMREITRLFSILKEKKILGNGLMLIKLTDLQKSNTITVRGLHPDRHPALNYSSNDVLIFSMINDKVPGSYRDGLFTTIYAVS